MEQEIRKERLPWADHVAQSFGEMPFFVRRRWAKMDDATRIQEVRLLVEELGADLELQPFVLDFILKVAGVIPDQRR